MPIDRLALARDYVARRRVNRLSFYRPYGWQMDVHNNQAPERLLMAANGVGKTMPGAAEMSIHVTGLYPDWWAGHRFNEPILAWAGTIDNDFQRDNNQFALLGKIGEGEGTGWIPQRCIKKIATRQAGIASVADEIEVRHVSGGTSIIRFRTYEQGWRKWQGAPPRLLWLDEQPDENAVNEADIYVEAQTRTVRNSGIILGTLTPLLGETEMIRHFTRGDAGTWWRGATWDDAPHLKETDKARLRSSYPDHQLEARTMGVPMMGEGKVFKVSEADIKCEPFEIPAHFRCLTGIDFGTGGKAHPFAASLIAYDADQDIIYVVATLRSTDETSILHAAAVKAQWPDFPVAWPHDGLNKKDTGANKALPLWQLYQGQGLDMLPMSARYDDDKGGGQATEPIVLDIQDRERTGRLKVFSTNDAYLEERRSYHRKNGQIVAIRDDGLKAAFYACMMLRYAVPARPVYMRSQTEGMRPIVSMGW